MSDDAVMMQHEYYRALAAREPGYEGVFLYGVRTTGVYCRPTCKSRRPLERNVEFFADATAACAAGYRPCKRCRPDQPAAPQAWLLDACRILQDDDRPIGLEALAARVGVSRAHLQRAFVRAFGVSPRRYAAAQRDERFRARLRAGERVTDAIYASGYGSASQAYALRALAPSCERVGAPGTTIWYGTAASRLGTVIVAATERGVCHVALGDDAGALEAGLRSTFDAATLVRADERVETAASALVRYLDRGEMLPDLPLDVRATVFQARVWNALRAIVPGRTATYGELAQALGDRNAARAVARACATNPVALLIPCHRVVGADGDLTGYRWGRERKRALLDAERATG